MHRPAFHLVAAAALLVAPLVRAQEPAPVELYVAPAGRDDWSGRLASPAADGREGPFATLERARDVIRTLRGAGERGAVRVLVRGGTYFLQRPLVFRPEDSGAAEAPVLYTAYPGERPVISGGALLAGWEPAEVNGARVLAAPAPAGCPPFRALYVRGERRPRPRAPAEGFLRIAELPDVTAETPWHQGQTRFRFAPGDLWAWQNVADVEVVALHFWVESRMPVARVDEAQRMVELSRRSVFRLTDDHSQQPARYYAENVLEALDAPGEWYLDRPAGKVYYVPRPGESAATLEAVAPRLAQLVRFEGEPEQGRFVEHVTLRGLTFAHAEPGAPGGWGAGWPAPDACGPPQAAVTLPGAVLMRGARGCALEDCLVEHVGGYGVELASGCAGNRIARCELRDLGAGGVKIGTTELPARAELATGGNEVSDCTIHDGGLVHHSAVGIWIGHSGGNTIAHNAIHHFFYTGISVGWSWGYGPSAARDNVIERNHVHHIGQGLLSDMGAIYTLGVSPGTVIRNNVFHDVESYGYGGWGIYFDEGTSGVVAEGNLVYRCKSNGFHQHYGRDNVVRNNVFALNWEAQIARTRAEEHLSFTFERNIVLWQEGTLLSGDWSGDGYRFDWNLYWAGLGPAGPARFAEWSWSEWRQRGQDAHSRIADPRFADPERGDFALQPGSPALELGFRPLEPAAAGPRR